MNRLSLIVVMGLLSATALAVIPARWKQTSEADFQGERNNVAVSSLGEVALAPEIKIVLPSDKAPTVVSAIAVADGKVYVASGVKAEVFVIEGGKALKLASPPGAMIGCLAISDKDVLAGTCGKEGGVYRLDRKGPAKKVWSDNDAKYVWAIVPGPGGAIYVATGPHGNVFKVAADGQTELLYQADKLAKNILSLAMGQDGLLYAGTDENGLVVEINPNTKASRVVLDADEKEISALTPAPGGGVFAATGDAAKPAAPAASGALPAGRPAPSPTSAPSEPLSAGGTDARRGETGLGAFATPTSQPAMKPAAEPAATSKPSVAAAAASAGKRRATGASPASSKGNAVYRIMPDGLVQTVLRRPAAVMAMIRLGDRLLLGTGDEGDLYSVSFTGDDVIRLLQADADQVTALSADADGAVYFGTANAGAVGMFGKAPAATGTFISKALDAGQIARWGTMSADGSLPAGAKVTIATRSGNLAEPDDATWSAWSGETPLIAAATSRPVVMAADDIKVASPAGRFLQYRLTLHAGDAGASPVVRQVEIAYQVANLPPAVSAMVVLPTAQPRERTAAPADQPETVVQPKAYRQVLVQASDPNGDKMELTLHFRQTDTANWIKMAEKLTEPKYVWDARGVGDGVYEIRATVSDLPSNPPASALSAARISELVVVDNTPPTVSKLSAVVAGPKAKVAGAIADPGSSVAAIHYSIDSATDWSAVQAADGICDSHDEDFAFELTDLSEGSHTITVRAADAFGNTGYATVTVTVGK